MSKKLEGKALLKRCLEKMDACESVRNHLLANYDSVEKAWRATELTGDDLLYAIRGTSTEYLLRLPVRLPPEGRWPKAKLEEMARDFVRWKGKCPGRLAVLKRYPSPPSIRQILNDTNPILVCLWDER